jgi:hypothetical protein
LAVGLRVALSAGAVGLRLALSACGWLLKQRRATEGFLRLFSWLNLFGGQ